MKNDAYNQILEYLKAQKRPVTPNELITKLLKSRVTIQLALKRLVESGWVRKQGTSPRVFYSIVTPVISPKITSVTPTLDLDETQIIQENFLLLEPDGTEIEGIQGFAQWCTKRDYDIHTKAREYLTLLAEYDRFKKSGIIDATSKLISSFDTTNIFLDSLWYLYPHSLPVFGKTKIAQWLFHAKQTENKILIKRVLDIIVPQVKEILIRNNFTTIAFVPATVPRKIQFMKEFEKAVESNLPKIIIEKIKAPILIQQKSLKDMNDRIKNAKETMVISSHSLNYTKVLLIDDFTGSGATLNALAQKIKQQDLAREVIGLTITGSMNGFEVIKEI